jgi:hypothetical protein
VLCCGGNSLEKKGKLSVGRNNKMAIINTEMIIYGSRTTIIIIVSS